MRIRSSGTVALDWLWTKRAGEGVGDCLLLRSELIDRVDDDLCLLELIAWKFWPTVRGVQAL